MKILYLFLLPFLFACEEPEKPRPPFYYAGSNASPVSGETQELKTQFSNDWDDWTINLGDTSGYFRPTWTNQWDEWDFKIGNITGDIEADWSNDWDEWTLKTGSRSVSIETNWSNDYDEWNIKEVATGFNAKVQTRWSNDFDEFEVKIDHVKRFEINTRWSNDFDEWEIKGSLNGIDPVHLTAILFVAVHTSALLKQGIVP